MVHPGFTLGEMAQKTYTPSYLGPWRKACGLTQQQLADELGMSKQHVSAVENGVRPYTQGYLEAVARALRRQAPAITPADLIGVDPDWPAAISLFREAARVPTAQADTAARVLRSLSEPANAPFQAEQNAPPKRRRTRR